ncbi:MAG: hypothetical protein LBR35_01035 [Rickettsiales bacterium]|jgi:opacity protein-like surface antigen|nr:hypothetical protein [Rickettsiales bacterium]
MKKILFIVISLLFVSEMSYSYGLRTFGGQRQNLQEFSIYFAIRGGVSYFKNTPDNALDRMNTRYSTLYGCASEASDEECVAAGNVVYYGPSYLASTPEDGPYDRYIDVNPEFAPFQDWEVGEDMSAVVGHIAFAFGGYIPSSNFRIEVEATQYLDADYDSTPFLKGRMLDLNEIPVGGIDTNLTTTMKSTVSSTAVLFNVIYDFKKGPVKKGSFIPFVGAGIGLGINETQTTINDSEGEMSNPQGSSFFKYSTCAANGDTEWTPACYYKESENTETSFAWSVMVGGNYILTADSSLEIGLKLTNLGQTTWTINRDDLSQDLLTTKNLMNTSAFIGYRKSF